MKQLARKSRCRPAFTLAEVTIALGVAGFCLATLFGLLPIGLTSNQASLSQTMASNISSTIISDLQCPLTSGSTPRFGFTLPSSSGQAVTLISNSAPQTVYFTANGSPTGTVGAGPLLGGSAVSVYRATLAFGAPAGGQRTATPVRVLITWPAGADPKPETWPVNYAGAYESDTALDCN